MNALIKPTIFAILSMIFLYGGCLNSSKKAIKPNIILILIDDLGYGDLACYGSKTNLTPNIDLLAAEGIIFTDLHSNGPMCTPTRAALLSGMYQNRLGSKFEGPLSGKTQYDEGLPLEVTTIAEVLKEAGYTTGMFGKWHLGYKPPFLPENQGFDEFRGLGAGDGDHHSHIDRWGREDWWHNGQISMETGYSVDLITDHSIDFIERNHTKPFFLYVAHLAIHFPWQGPNDPAQRIKGVDYENDKWGIIPDRNNVRPHVQAMVESVDQGTGNIIATLKELGIEDNTLVIFTSDNGGYIHYNHEFHNISSNGMFRGQKTEVYEGGHRVPFIAWWPGKIEGGKVINQTAMTMDLFSTFAHLAGADMPSGQPNDGLDLSPVLFENNALPERTLFWKMDDEIAVRKGDWKLVKISENTAELYNLADDPSEKVNLADTLPDVVTSLLKEYNQWKEEMDTSAAQWE